MTRGDIHRAVDGNTHIGRFQGRSIVDARVAAERLKSWVNLTEQKIGPLQIKAYLNIGNDDFQNAGQIIENSTTHSILTTRYSN